MAELDPESIVQYQDYLKDLSQMLKGEQAAARRLRLMQVGASALGTKEAHAVAQGMAGRYREKYGGSSQAQDTQQLTMLANLLKESTDMGYAIPEEVLKVLPPGLSLGLRAYRAAQQGTPEGQARRAASTVADLDRRAMVEAQAERATGSPLGLELPVGGPGPQDLDSGAAGRAQRQMTREQAMSTLSGFEGLAEAVPTSAALALTPEVVNAGTTRQRLTLERQKAEQPDFDVRQSTRRTPDGTEIPEFYLIDKKTGQLSATITGTPSAPAMTDMGKALQNYRDALAKGDHKAALVFAAELQKKAANEGWSVQTDGKGGMLIRQGPTGDKVIDRHLIQQDMAVANYERTLNLIDSLNLGPGDFGAGKTVQGAIQNMIAGSTELAGAISNFPAQAIAQVGGLKPDVQAKYFNPSLPQAELFFNALALVRAGIYGQEGRSLSDKDMEMFRQGVIPKSHQEWLAIRQGIMAEITSKRNEINEFKSKLSPEAKGPLHFLYEDIPGTLNLSTPAGPHAGLRGDIDRFIDERAPGLMLDPVMVKAMVMAESSYNPKAIGPRTRNGEQAVGLLQLMPGTAQRLGVTDRTDVVQNLTGGMTDLGRFAIMYQGDMDKILAAHHAGEGAVAKYNGVPPYADTQQFIRNVRGIMAQMRGQPASTPQGQAPSVAHKPAGPPSALNFAPARKTTTEARPLNAP